MDSVYILILMVTGAFAGFTGSMLGLGGAFIMTPVQYIIYRRLGLPDHLALMTAFGTSLLVVLSTAISGALRHHRAGAVVWKAAVVIGVVSSAAAFGGSTLSAHLPGHALRIAFGIVLLLAGARMVTAGTKKRKSHGSRSSIGRRLACPVRYASRKKRKAFTPAKTTSST